MRFAVGELGSGDDSTQKRERGGARGAETETAETETERRQGPAAPPARRGGRMRAGRRRLGFPCGLDFRQDAGAQRVRHRVVEAAVDRGAGARDIGGGFPADRTARLVRRERGGLGGVELPVQLRLHQQDLVALGRRGHACLALQHGARQKPAGTEQARHHRADRRPRDLGDLLVGKLLQLAQHERLAQLRRQRRDQLLDLPVAARVDQRRFRVVRFGYKLVLGDRSASLRAVRSATSGARPSRSRAE